jgi:hypothetical protein
VEATPGLAFNVLGTNHTVTFTCGAGVGPNASGVGPNTGAVIPTDLAGGNANSAAFGGAGLVPGCYDVSASITDESGGGGASITSATCGDNATTLSGSTVNCASYASPLCPIGATTFPATGAFCTDSDVNAPRGSQLRVTINPGSPHAYLITFTGYTPLLATCSAPPPGAAPVVPGGASGEAVATADGRGLCYTNPPGTPLGTVAPGTAACAPGVVSSACGPTGPACPVGFTYVPGPFQVTTNLFVPPFEAPLTAPDGVCSFSVSAEKKYVEITTLTLTPTGCSTVASPASLVFSEGLKAFFGPSCTVVASATGVVIL